MKNHKLIVLEGIDGVGKTTLVNTFTQHLNNSGIPAVCYENVENEHSVFNEAKRRVKETTILEAQFYFYLASAIQKSSHIDKLLQEQWIVCDRYVYSTYAYHLAKGMDIVNMPKLKMLPIRVPDIALLLTLDEQVRQERVEKREYNDIDDYELKESGSFLYRFETELKKFNLEELNTDGSVLDINRKILSRALIRGKLTSSLNRQHW